MMVAGGARIDFQHVLQSSDGRPISVAVSGGEGDQREKSKIPEKKLTNRAASVGVPAVAVNGVASSTW